MIRLPRSAAAICVLLFALAAGCSGWVGALAEPTPLGPDEILARSIARLETSATFHVEATIGGSIKAGSLGSLAGGIPIGLLGNLKLDGASITGDVDVADRAAHLTASFPSLFGARAEVVLVDGYGYTKVSLLGDKFTKSKAPALLAGQSAGANPTLNFRVAAGRVKEIFDAAGTSAVLLEPDSVDGQAAYHLSLAMSVAGLARLFQEAGVGAATAGLSIQLAQFDYWVFIDTLRPARFKLKASSDAVGSVDVDLSLTGYDRPVKITAPPAAQVNGT